VGFEPTIPVFEWAKTIHALDSTVTVIGLKFITGAFSTRKRTEVDEKRGVLNCLRLQKINSSDSSLCFDTRSQGKRRIREKFIPHRQTIPVKILVRGCMSSGGAEIFHNLKGVMNIKDCTIKRGKKSVHSITEFRRTSHQ
jgi:hypothetical protein